MTKKQKEITNRDLAKMIVVTKSDLGKKIDSSNEGLARMIEKSVAKKEDLLSLATKEDLGDGLHELRKDLVEDIDSLNFSRQSDIRKVNRRVTRLEKAVFTST